MSDTQAVLAVNQAFYRAFEQKDLQTMSHLWSQTMTSTCVHPGRPPLRGWEQIRFAWEQIFRSTEAFQIQTDIINTEISGNLAYVFLVAKLVQVINGRPMEAQSVITNVFERTANAWYLIHHHGSPIMPPPNQPGNPSPNQPPNQPPRA